MCTTNSVISPTPTAARALCGSSAISWIELVRSTLLALVSSADFLPSCHSAIRDPIAYPALRFRASTLLSRKNVSPLRKFVSRSRAKMDQALPPLFVRAGQRSYGDYCAEGGRSLGTRLGTANALYSVVMKFLRLLPCSCDKGARALFTRNTLARSFSRLHDFCTLCTCNDRVLVSTDLGQ